MFLHPSTLQSDPIGGKYCAIRGSGQQACYACSGHKLPHVCRCRSFDGSPTLNGSAKAGNADASFAILPAVKAEAFRRHLPCRLDSVARGIHPVMMPVQSRRISKRGWRHATLAEFGVDDRFPCRLRAFNRAIQHQRFLNADQGALAVGFSLVKTDRTGRYVFGLQRPNGD